MATTILTNTQFTTEVLGFSDIFYVAATGRILTTGGANGIENDLNATGVTVTVDGVVASEQYAIFLDDNASGNGFHAVTIGREGVVRSLDINTNYGGLFVSGDGSRVVNNGEVHGGNGVILRGDGNVLTNTGLITGQTLGINNAESDATATRILNSGTVAADDAGIRSFSADSMEIVNSGTISGGIGIDMILGGTLDVANSGTIAGMTTGIDAGAAARLDLRNTGEISTSGGTGVAGSNAADSVENGGTIAGNVSLGGGADVFDGRHGTVIGTVAGGNGGDTLITGAGDDDLAGGNGGDLMKAGAGADEMAGGAGNDDMRGGRDDDVMDGGAQRDLINGGRGDDELTGGGDFDRFIFARRSDDDVITDFQNGTDRMDFSRLGALSLGDVAAASSDLADGLLIDLDQLGGDGSVLVLGFASADLTRDDLIL